MIHILSHESGFLSSGKKHPVPVDVSDISKRVSNVLALSARIQRHTYSTSRLAVNLGAVCPYWNAVNNLSVASETSQFQKTRIGKFPFDGQILVLRNFLRIGKITFYVSIERLIR